VSSRDARLRRLEAQQALIEAAIAVLGVAAADRAFFRRCWATPPEEHSTPDLTRMARLVGLTVPDTCRRSGATSEV
jgi:hypothetical protein